MTIKASNTVTITNVNDGKNGENVESITKYYLLSPSLSKPKKPKIHPPGKSWTTTEPDYNASDGTKILYTVEYIKLTDGTGFYSEVQKSSSYSAAIDAAKTASNYITDETNGIFVHPQSNTTDGVKITSTVDIVKSGVVLASYGDGITLGDDTQAGYMQIKNGQISIQFHNTALNETGWIDFGTGSDGTNVLNIYANVGSMLSTILNLDLYGNATFSGDVESAGNVLSFGNITAGGAVSANNFKCGTVTITPTAAGAVTSKTIYFDKSFRSTPVVVCNPVSTRPDICTCAPSSISQNSFELNFYRTNKTATRINWFAFATS